MIAVLFLAAAAACDRNTGGAQVRVVDLLAQIGNAERRPAGAPFEMAEHTFGGRSRASVAVPPESRMIWKMLLPHRATLRLFVGVPDENGPASVAVRVGVSDGRIYTTVMEPTMTSDDTARQGWVPLAADLSPFAGRKLSLFYRADRQRWEIILGTHALSGAPAAVYLAEPGIDTDSTSAREYMKRRTVSPKG